LSAPTDPAEVARRIRFIVAAVMDLPEDSITTVTHLAHDLGADDLDRLEIIFAVEALCDLELSDEEAEQVRTVGDLVAKLQTRLRAIEPQPV